jgi:hypothetical protein
MRKQNGPAIADPLVEVDRAFRSVGGEVGGFVIDSEGHDYSPVGSVVFAAEKFKI